MSNIQTKWLKKVHLRSMFQEYKWIPGLSHRILWQTLLSLSVYFITAGVLYCWMRYGEPINFYFHPQRALLFPFFILIAGTISAISTFQSVKKFRMISTDQGLEVSRGSRELVVKYADISKVEVLPKGELMIFTNASKSIPALVISNEISNRPQLEGILHQFVIFQNTDKIPWAINFHYRNLMTLWFLLSLSVNVVSTDPGMRIISGIIFLGFASYAFAMLWIFRTQIKSHHYLIMMAILSLVVIFRLVIVFINPG